MNNNDKETLEENILRIATNSFKAYKEASSNLIIKQGEADNLVRRILSLTIKENNA